MTKIEDRLKPLAEMYAVLDKSSFESEEDEEATCHNVKELGFFSVPMLEALLSRAKKEREQILCTDVPLLLAEYGLSEGKLTDGTVVGKEIVYEVSQAGKDKNLLATWLTANGYQSVIKDTLSFDKGSYHEEIDEFLKARGYSYSKDSEVHSATLKKTIRDHILAGGQKPPEEAIKLSIFERGVIKPPKKPAGF